MACVHRGIIQAISHNIGIILLLVLTVVSYYCRANLSYQAKRKDGERRLEKVCNKLDRERFLQEQKHLKEKEGRVCSVIAVSSMPLTTSDGDGFRGAMLTICEAGGGEKGLESLRTMAAAGLTTGACNAFLVADASVLIAARWPTETSTPGLVNQGPVSKPLARVVKRICKEGATVAAIGEKCGLVLARLMHDPAVVERVSTFVFVAPSLATMRQAGMLMRCGELAGNGAVLTLVLHRDVAESDEGQKLKELLRPHVSVVWVGGAGQDGIHLDMDEVGVCMAQSALRAMGFGGELGERVDIGDLVLSRVVLKEGKGGYVGFEEIAGYWDEEEEDAEAMGSEGASGSEKHDDCGSESGILDANVGFQLRAENKQEVGSSDTSDSELAIERDLAEGGFGQSGSLHL